jgi:hypothetical protein
MRMDGHEVMQDLWESLNKDEGGQYIEYTLSDIKMLWLLGFVDTERVSMEQWLQIFDAFAQGNERYRLSYPEFCALDAYRFKGELFEPFDAFQINEGKYTHDALQELIDASIAPCCMKRGADFVRWCDDWRSSMRGSDGLYVMNHAAKTKCAALLEDFPSPLRRLELLTAVSLQVHIAEWLASGGSSIARGAHGQKSIFTTLSCSKAESIHTDLRSLEKTRGVQKGEELPANPNAPKLGRITRSRRGQRL